jgi:hypothetical protein
MFPDRLNLCSEVHQDVCQCGGVQEGTSAADLTKRSHEKPRCSWSVMSGSASPRHEISSNCFFQNLVEQNTWEAVELKLPEQVADNRGISDLRPAEWTN